MLWYDCQYNLVHAARYAHDIVTIFQVSLFCACVTQAPCRRCHSHRNREAPERCGRDPHSAVDAHRGCPRFVLFLCDQGPGRTKIRTWSWFTNSCRGPPRSCAASATTLRQVLLLVNASCENTSLLNYPRGTRAFVSGMYVVESNFHAKRGSCPVAVGLFDQIIDFRPTLRVPGAAAAAVAIAKDNSN